MPSQIRPTRQEVSDRFPMLGFMITTDGDGKRYEVVIASDAALFRPDAKPNRTRANFYSSRAAGLQPVERGEAVYVVPPEVLARFAGQERLYYVLATYSNGKSTSSEFTSLPSEGSAYINVKGLSGRTLSRVRLLPSRQRAAGGYGNGSGAELEWGGDVAMPGTEPVNGRTSAAPAVGPGPSQAALAYNDGFGPLPRARPQEASSEDEMDAHGIEEPIPDANPLAIPEQQAYSSALQDSEYPQASRFVLAASGNYRSVSTPRTIDRVVIHITAGQSKISGTIGWFQNPDQRDRNGKHITVSAHYVIGQDGEVVQMVKHNDVAWHASSANSHSIGIEHVARPPRAFNAKDPGLYPTEAEYCCSAALVRWLCEQFGIPMDRDHILGHSEADPRTTHTSCPNSVWDWDYFMGMVTSATCYARDAAPAAQSAGLSASYPGSRRGRASAYQPQGYGRGLEDEDPYADLGFSFAMRCGESINDRVVRCCREALANGPMGKTARHDSYREFISAGQEKSPAAAEVLTGVTTSCAMFVRAVRLWCGAPSGGPYKIGTGMFVSMGNVSFQHPAFVPLKGGATPNPGDWFYIASSQSSLDGHTGIFLAPTEDGAWETAEGGGGDDGTLCRINRRQISGNKFSDDHRTLWGWFDCTKVGLPESAACETGDPSASENANGYQAAATALVHPYRQFEPFWINWEDVQQIPQPTGHSCWTTAAAMILGWRDGISLTPEMVGEIAGRSTVRGEVSPSESRQLAIDLGLVYEAPESYTIDTFRTLLEDKGPLWVGLAGPNGHAIVVTGLNSVHGSVSGETVFVRITDPWDRAVDHFGRPGSYLGTHSKGSHYEQPWAEFVAEYGNVGTPAGTIYVQTLHAGGTRGRWATRLAPGGGVKFTPRPIPQAQAAESFSINWDDVELIPQPTGKSCWATAAAMILGWRGKVSLTPEAVADIAGRSTATGLDPKQRRQFAGEIGLACEPPQSYSIDKFRNMLEDYGPLWVSVQLPGSGHAIVVTGMYSDGAEDGSDTYVRIADPWDRVVGSPGAPGAYLSSHNTGSRYIMTWDAFTSEYEQRASTAPDGSVNAQILHTDGPGDDRQPRRSGAAGYAMAVSESNGPNKTSLAPPPAPTKRVVRAMDGGAVAIASVVVGAVMERILNSEGDITWSLDQLRGLKHPNDTPPTPMPGFHDAPTIRLNDWPSHENKATDEISAWFAIDWQFNGRSLGNVRIANIGTNDALGWGLNVEARIMDDNILYPFVSPPCAALRVTFNYRFTRSLFSDLIASTELHLYGDGTFEKTSRWEQR